MTSRQVVSLTLLIMVAFATFHTLFFDAANRMEEPGLRFPRALREVSGLTLLPDGRLATMTDEQAIVYAFDPTTREVVTLLTIGEPVLNDFEGIAIHDGHLYLVTSTGMLYRDGTDAPTSTGLSDICEIEGMDAEDERLFLVCKTNYRDQDSGHLLIYAYDPAGESLELAHRIPWARLNVDALSPSGIIVEADRILVIAAKEKQLLALDRNGALTGVFRLKGHRQAEGIAVLADGRIAITDEGKKGSGGVLTIYEPSELNLDIPR